MSARMRVSFLLPRWTPYPSGGYRAVFELANQLAARGHSVSLVCPLSERPNPRARKAWLRARSKPGFGLLAPPWFEFHAGARLLVRPSLEARYLPDGDAVVATAHQTACWAWGAPRRKGRKYYFIQHLEVWGGPPMEVLETWRLPLRKIVVSRWLQRLAQALGERAELVSCGLDPGLFRVLRPIESRDPLTVAAMYHKAGWKGFQEALRAVQRAKRRVPGLKLVAFGVFPRDPLLPRWVEYHADPAQQELAALYNRAGIFVSASRLEGYGLPPAEAMACGCAVAARDNLGVREFARHGENALLSPVHDRDGLAEDLLRLVRDRPLRIRLAREGARSVGRLGWARAGAAFERALADGR